MSNGNRDGERIDRRSYLTGSAATLGALSIGAGSVTAGDERKKGEKNGDENGENGTGDDDRTVITECTTITEPGTYVLGDDLEAEADEACIVVRADDVLLDGRGRTISGPARTEGVGVLVQPPAGDPIANVRITNLVVEDLNGGIVFDNVTDGLVMNVTSQMATISGTSFLVLESHQNQFVDNTIERGGAGIWARDSNENVFVGNSTRRTFLSGIVLSRSDGNLLTENSVIGADGLGFEVQESDGNWFVGNIAEENVGGFILHNSNENRLDLNAANENVAVGGTVGYGIGGDRNTGRGNTAEGNPLGPITINGTGNAIEVNGTVYTGAESETGAAETAAQADGEIETEAVNTAQAAETEDGAEAAAQQQRLLQFVQDVRP